MIRKINILLILTSIIITFYIVFTRDNNIVIILKDLSIILTINALYILKKLFKINLSEGVIFVYILFAFIAHFLGVICDFYGKIYWFDKFAHFYSGIVGSFAAIYILIKTKNKNNIIFSIIFIISFTMLTASLWEVFEYISSILFNMDPQKVLTTGVNDTMGDIIVALLGSAIISLVYYFEYKHDKNFIIKRFVKHL